MGRMYSDIFIESDGARGAAATAGDVSEFGLEQSFFTSVCVVRAQCVVRTTFCMSKKDIFTPFQLTGNLNPNIQWKGCVTLPSARG